MSVKENQKLNQPGNMEQVRELMFGAQTRLFEDEITKLNSKLDAMHSSVTGQIEDLTTKLREEYSSSTDILEQKIKNLTLSTQEDNSDVKEQLVKQEKKTNRGLDTLQEEIESQLSTIKTENNNARTTVKKELDTVKQAIYKLLKEQINTVNENKVSKDDFSEMLVDMAMKVKGTNLQSSLENMLQEQKTTK